MKSTTIAWIGFSISVTALIVSVVALVMVLL